MARDYGSMPPANPEEVEQVIPRRSGLRAVVGRVGYALLSVGAFVVVVNNVAPHAKTSLVEGTTTLVETMKTKSTTSGLDFAATNEYSDTTAQPAGSAYPFIKKGKLVEPMRQTTFTATHETYELETCSWKINQEVSSQSSKTDTPWGAGVPGGGLTMTGVEVVMMVESPGEYQITLSCETTDGTTVENEPETVASLFVRRELRSMSMSDRHAYLDAFKIMSELSTTEGQSTYGSTYSSLDTFVALHLNTAGARSHDKIHDGMGVVTQHVAITQAFESSLQSIAPQLTVPYWDYTRDSATTKETQMGLDSKIFQISELWSSDFFGSSVGDDEHTILNGRFAFQKVGMVTDETAGSILHGPYGYLRAPWNINPSPYVTRYHKLCGVAPEDTYIDTDDTIKDLTDYKWPSCASHWELTFDTDYDTWYDWVWKSSYAPHGPVHAWIGGVGGDSCDETGDDAHYNKLIGLVDSHHVTLLKMNLFGYLKNMWRMELVETPHFCSLDAVDECTFKCNKNATRGDETFLSMIKSSLSMWTFDTDDMTDAEIMKIADVSLCNAKFWPGDHLEAASPVEASFWPIHPTLDRLLQYKALVQPFTSHSWADLDDSEEVCSSTASSDCYGHHPYDLTFWKTTISDDSGSFTSSYRTNEEVRVSLNPIGGDYSMPYIYDNFDWDHCANSDHSFKVVG